MLQQNMGEEGKTAEPVTDTKIYRGGIIPCFREISSTEENNFLLVDEALSKGVIVYFYSGKSTQCCGGTVGTHSQFTAAGQVCVYKYVQQNIDITKMTTDPLVMVRNNSEMPAAVLIYSWKCCRRVGVHTV